MVIVDIIKPINKYKVQIVFDNKIHLHPRLGVYESSCELLQMIDWLGQEAIKDWTKTHELIEAERAVNKIPPIRKSLSIRMGSRTLSYVNHLFLLNGILKQGLKISLELLKEKGLADHIDLLEYQTRLDKLEEVFKPIKIFRHKVAAHTSFAKPDKDSDLTQFDSLLNLVPDPGSSVMGNRSFAYKINDKLSLVSILTFKTDVEQYFTDWAELYTYVFEPLKKHFKHTRGRIEL